MGAEPMRRWTKRIGLLLGVALGLGVLLLAPSSILSGVFGFVADGNEILRGADGGARRRRAGGTRRGGDGGAAARAWGAARAVGGGRALPRGCCLAAGYAAGLTRAENDSAARAGCFGRRV